MFKCLVGTTEVVPFPEESYPCRCLCFVFTQITRTTPLRWMILHLSQIFLTDARTFIKTRPWSLVSAELRSACTGEDARAYIAYLYR